MPIKATILLDSGSFLPKEVPEDKHCDIGYFECAPQASDIKVFVDGVEKQFQEKLGGKKIGVLHKDANGNVKTGKITASPTFHTSLLHLNELYGNDIKVDRKKFDCIIRFDSGDFHESDVRMRRFKETPTNQTKDVRPISHDVEVRFTLADGEVLELTRDGRPFLSSNQFGAKKDLVIKLACDYTTAEKFYRDAFEYARDKHWLPNPDDPPPMCPTPPCQPGN